MSATWLDRLILGQMALRLSREHLAGVHAIRQMDVPTLFTNELTLNYQNPLIGNIWQRCSDALGSIPSDRRIAGHQWPLDSVPQNRR